MIPSKELEKVYSEIEKYSEALRIFREYKKIKKVIGLQKTRRFSDKREIEENLVGKNIFELIENLGVETDEHRKIRNSKRYYQKS